MKKIVVIGGGTGTSVVLNGLKNKEVDLAAIVSVADSGGSTGRLRDEFGFQPVGDLRQSLAALAKDKSQDWIRQLLLYRFSHGEGLKGHNLGNLILTALQDMASSTPEALEIAREIFRLEGKIYPITTENVNLVIEYENGEIVIGEDYLNAGHSGGKKIKNIKLFPRAKIYKKAEEAIINADLVVIGPGDLYASILPNFAVSGIKKTFLQTKGKVVYVVNIMTSFAQTWNYKASDHVSEVEKYIGRKVDFVLINNGKVDKEIVEKYEKENESLVENDLDKKEFKVIEDNFVKIAKDNDKAGDNLHRSLLRHDENKLTKVLMGIMS